MRRVVWIDDWQMQCCGEPFAVGDEVRLTVGSADASWLRPVFEAETPAVTDVEDHHELQRNPYPLDGRVTRIRLAHALRAHGRGREGGAVHGSGGLDDVRRATRDDQAPDGRSLLGYVVDLEVRQRGPGD